MPPKRKQWTVLPSGRVVEKPAKPETDSFLSATSSLAAAAASEGLVGSLTSFSSTKKKKPGPKGTATSHPAISRAAPKMKAATTKPRNSKIPQPPIPPRPAAPEVSMAGLLSRKRAAEEIEDQAKTRKKPLLLLLPPTLACLPWEGGGGGDTILLPPSIRDALSEAGESPTSVSPAFFEIRNASATGGPPLRLTVAADPSWLAPQGKVGLTPHQMSRLALSPAGEVSIKYLKLPECRGVVLEVGGEVGEEDVKRALGEFGWVRKGAVLRVRGHRVKVLSTTPVDAVSNALRYSATATAVTLKIAASAPAAPPIPTLSVGGPSCASHLVVAPGTVVRVEAAAPSPLCLAAKTLSDPSLPAPALLYASAENVRPTLEDHTWGGSHTLSCPFEGASGVFHVLLQGERCALHASVGGDAREESRRETPITINPAMLDDWCTSLAATPLPEEVSKRLPPGTDLSNLSCLEQLLSLSYPPIHSAAWAAVLTTNRIAALSFNVRLPLVLCMPPSSLSPQLLRGFRAALDAPGGDASLLYILHSLASDDTKIRSNAFSLLKSLER